MKRRWNFRRLPVGLLICLVTTLVRATPLSYTGGATATGTLTNDQWAFFEVAIPTNNAGWRLTLNVTGADDINLYLARGTNPPSTGSYLRASTGKATDTIILTETETTPENAPTNYVVGVYLPPGTNGPVNFTLTSEDHYLTTLAWDPGTTHAGTVVFTNASTTGGDYYFKVTAQNTAVGAWRTALNVSSGEADVYLLQGSLPTTSYYNYRSERTGSDGFVLHSSQFTPGQDWYLLVHATAGAQWNLVSGEAYAWNLGALASDDSSSTNVVCGAEGIAYFKTTVPSDTLAWSLWLHGGANELRVRKNAMPHPVSGPNNEPIPQNGQMLVVPDFLAAGTFNGTYFVGVPANPGEAVNLDSRKLAVADIDFDSTNGPVTVTNWGYRAYRVQVPVEQIAWEVKVLPSSGNPNFAVRRDSVPNEYNNDAFSEAAGSTADSLTLVPPTLSDGTFFITVFGNAPYSFTLASGNPVVTDVPFLGSNTNTDLNRVGWRFYRVTDIASQVGKLGWDLLLQSQPTGTEIALRRNAVPSRWNYRQGNNAYVYTSSQLDYSSLLGELQRPGHQADIWYIGIYNPTNPLDAFTLVRQELIPQTMAFESSVSRTYAPVGQWTFFRIDVPTNALGWDLRLVNVTSGQPQLVVRRDLLPDSLGNNFGPWTWGGPEPWRATNWISGGQWVAESDWTSWAYSADGTNEHGRILTMSMGNPLEPGTYYVGVVNAGYPGNGGYGPMSYTLQSRGIGGGQAISIQDLPYVGSVTNSGLAVREATYYRVQIASNTPSWRLKLSPASGDALFVLQKDALPNVGAGRTYGGRFHDALGFHGGNRLQKAGDEHCAVFPSEGQTNLAAGTYYLAVVSEGVGVDSSRNRIGSGSSDYVLESLGAMPVTDLGTTTTNGVAVTNTLAGGTVVAYQFAIPLNAPSVEVRLDDRVGNPMLALRGGAAIPTAPDPSLGYGRDGGYESGRQTDYNLLTLANPSNGVYSLVVQATHDPDGTYPDAGYVLRVRIVPPTVVAFDGGTVSVTNQTLGNWRFFQVNVPTNGLGWDLRLANVTSGRPQLVVRRDQLPDALANTFGPWSWGGPEPWRNTNWPSGEKWVANSDWTGWTYSAGGSNELGQILTMALGNPLEPGTYYIGVVNAGYPWDTSSGPMSYTLSSRGIGDGQTISIQDLAYTGGSATNSGLAVREAAYYRVQIASNTPSWKLKLTPTSGDALLVLQKDVLPNVEAGRTYGGRYHEALGFHGGNRMQKAGDEHCVVFPPEGQTNLVAGTYYLAVVSEGVGVDSSPSRIGSGNSDYVLESLGAMPVLDLGTVTTNGSVTPNSLAGGEVAAYQFTVPPNTPSIEVRLNNRVGYPMLAQRGGGEMPMPPDPAWGYYGRDGGYESGRLTDYNILTLANPSNGVYSLIVQATHAPDGSYPDAGYELHVRALPPELVTFDGGIVSITNQPVGNWRFFQVNVPTNASGWDLRLVNVTSGRPQLVVRRDQLPDAPANTFGPWSWGGPEPWRDTNWPSGEKWLANYDWTGWTYSADGTNENGRIMTMGLGNPLEPGTYYLGVVNYGYPGDTSSGPMSYTLLSRGIGDGQTISIQDLAFSGGSATNSGLAVREAAYYRVQIPSNTPSWKLRLTPTSGDASLVVQKDALPNVEAGRTYGWRQHDALGFHGGNRMQKAADEQCVVLPRPGETNIAAGTYYLAVVSEGLGVNSSSGWIGSGTSDYVLESLGAMPWTDLGTVNTTGLVVTNALAGGESAAYRFTVPPGAPAVEARFENQVGYPMLALRPGGELAVPPGNSPPYGADGGYEAGRLTAQNILTLPNPGSGVYSIIVQATHNPADGTFPDATYILRVRQPDIPQLNLAGSQNTNGLTNVVSGVLADNQRAFYRVDVPATLNGVAVVGWRMDLLLNQGSASVRVRKALLPVDEYYSDTSPYASPMACIVPPYLTPGTWYVEVRGSGAADYTLTSSLLETERTWLMPEPGQPPATPGLSGLEFGDSGTDTNGDPILDPQTGTVTDQGIDLEQGRLDYYAIIVSATNDGAFRTVLEAISGNPDLYLRAGYPSTLSHGPTPSWPWSSSTLFDRLQTGSTTEYGNWVPIDGRFESRLAPGIWYLAVHAAGNSNARYRLHVFSSDIQDLALEGGGLSGQALLGGDWRYYRVQVPTDAPANWDITFSQQAGDVVMYLRDTAPPGFGQNAGDIRDWQNDSKNSGTHPNYDPAGTYTLNVPSVRPGHTYYLGFRAVNDAVFSVSSATSGGTFAGTNDLPFYGGGVTGLLPAYGSALYRIVVPEDAVRWRSYTTNADSVVFYLEQGTIPIPAPYSAHLQSWGANVYWNTSLLNTNSWPWFPDQTYFLMVTNTTATEQPFTFQMDGRSALTEDEDNDGLPDAWENLYFGNTWSQHGSYDPDLDGLTNAQELALGSNPMDANTRGYISSIVVSAGGVLHLEIIGEVGRRYRVQASSDLEVWSTITNIMATSNSFEVIDAAAVGLERRFYRLVSP